MTLCSTAISIHVGGKPIGPDVFQKTDISGVSLPITRARARAETHPQAPLNFHWRTADRRRYSGKI
jgi:hypothetical protein